MTTTRFLTAPLACILAAASAQAQTALPINPDRVPVQTDQMAAEFFEGQTAPIVIDLQDYFTVYTPPGPRVDLKLANTPKGVGDTLTLQLWWVDPEPEEAGTTVTDTTEPRLPGQVLDLTQARHITRLLQLMRAGTLDNAIVSRSFYDTSSNPARWSLLETFAYRNVTGTSGDDRSIEPIIPSWPPSTINRIRRSKGLTGVIVSTSTTSFQINVDEDRFTDLPVMGKIIDEHLPLLDILVGKGGDEAHVKLWNFNSTPAGYQFPQVPLWTSYAPTVIRDPLPTPAREDYITIGSITEHLDRIHADQSLFFTEPKLVVDDEDEEEEPVDENADIKEVFDISIDGSVLTLTPKEALKPENAKPYILTILAALPDGSGEDELSDPNYFYRTSITVFGQRAFARYLGGNVVTEIDPSKDGFDWYNVGLGSTGFGWLYARGFFNSDDSNALYRWAYSTRHGWIYMSEEEEGDGVADGVWDWYGAWWYFFGDGSTPQAGWMWLSTYNWAPFPYMYSLTDYDPGIPDDDSLASVNGWIVYGWVPPVPNDPATEIDDSVPGYARFWSYRQNKYVTVEQLGADKRQ